MQDTRKNPFIPPRGAMLRWKSTVAAAALGLAVGASFLPAFSQAPITAPAQTQQAVAPVSFADMIEKVQPAVVSVKVTMAQSSMEEGDGSGVAPEDLPPGIREFFRQFGQQMPRQRGGQVRMGQGSGFFISADGEIVTNNHVVKGASSVEITTNDGRTLQARVVGTDPRTDVALLKVKESGTFPYVKLASAAPRVGDWVLAVGNPFGLGGTVTAGIVSARGRDIGSGPYDDYLQIDAAVNRGNSGGPTFGLSGEVIGMNTAIYSPSGGNVGIAFAIPSTTIIKVVDALRSGHEVERGFIGVASQPVSQDLADALGLPDTKGALIASVSDGSPGAKAGLKKGQLITAVNGEKIDTPRDLARKIGEMKPGDKATLTVMRGGKQETVTVDLGKRPPETRADSGDHGRRVPRDDGQGFGKRGG